MPVLGMRLLPRRGRGICEDLAELTAAGLRLLDDDVADALRTDVSVCLDDDRAQLLGECRSRRVVVIPETILRTLPTAAPCAFGPDGGSGFLGSSGPEV